MLFPASIDAAFLARTFAQNPWLVAAPAALFLFYLIAWLAIGREPKPGTVVTCYEPPDNLSAAGVRYVTTTGSDGRSLAAVIAQLATCGCVRVEPESGAYKISRLLSDRATEGKLAPEEKRVLALLFEDGPEIVMTPSMDERNAAQQGRYVFHIQKELTKQFKGKYFTRHAGIIAIGVLATFAIAVILGIAAQARSTTGTVFFTVWLLFAGLTIGLLAETSLASAVRAASRAGAGWIKLLPAAAAIAVFSAVIAYMLRELAKEASPAYSWMLASLLFINLLWGPFFKRTTREGRRVLDHIAGFKLFLEKVEQDRLDKLNPAAEALEDRSKYLCYAIALELKEAWGNHLAQTFFVATTVR